jgi:hypothetical protein
MATRQFNIFVEGTDDHDLVLTLVKELRNTIRHSTKKNTREGQRVTTYLQIAGIDDDILISSIGGWHKLGADQAFSIQQAADSGGKTLIVFDADEAPTERAQVLTRAIAAYEPAPAIFLLPGFEQAGELEDLLLQLVQPQHRAVMTCYDGYEQCLQGLLTAGQPYYNTPSKKRRLYDYVNVMPLEGDQWERHHKKGGQKIFENTDIWDLGAPAIQPLRDFLNQNLP